MEFKIEEPDKKIRQEIKANWDRVAKPLDGLGEFEGLLARIGAILGSPEIDIAKKALNEIPTRLKQPVYMLFDYENRDPLDHQAHVTEVAAASMTEGAENVGKAKLC